MIILTLNEEINLPHCLESLAGHVQSIYVIDSGSTDRTAEIARQFGACLLEHSFESHLQQWRWALEQLPSSCEWILGIEADQRITPELWAELESCFSSDPEVDGFYLCRRQIFRGRWIRHGGYYPKYLLKLFRRSRCVFDSLDLVDHHFYVSGKTATLRHDLIEENRKENRITFWIEKHMHYAERIAAEESLRAEDPDAAPLRAAFFGTPDQRGLWRRRLWRGLPLYVRPFLYFFYRYFLRLGFLDGKQGFIFHYLQAFWFRLLVDINRDELRVNGHGRPRP